MTLVRENITSLYRQIADTLRQEIAAGHFQPGGKLPSEAALEQRFAVSRVTVRLALKHLTEQGMVERKQGKGTYISGKKVAHGINVMRSFHESLKQQGLNATMRLLVKEEVPTPESLQSLFQMSRTLTFISRLHLVDNDPIAVGYSHFPAFPHELSWEETEKEPTWVLLEKPRNITSVAPILPSGWPSRIRDSLTCWEPIKTRRFFYWSEHPGLKTGSALRTLAFSFVRNATSLF